MSKKNKPCSNPGKKRRARARRIRNRVGKMLKRHRELDENPKEYCGCGFCDTILIWNADLSYQILGIAHDGCSPRMCSICMNKMEHPVEKWERQAWMNSYEMATIWNAVKKGRKINQDIIDAILGLMDRTIDRLAAKHKRRQAEPEFIDDTWYRNAGQAYAYIAKLIVLISLWEWCEGDEDMRMWLKKTPFIVTKPRPPGTTLKQAKALIGHGKRTKQQTEAMERAARDAWEVVKSDGRWLGKRRREGKIRSCENRVADERRRPEVSGV